MNIINKLTLRHMRLNKRRTLVTVIGIIISVAMITAVSTVGYSVMDYMARKAMVNNGFFHVKFDNYYYGDNGKIVDEFDVENYTIMKPVGDYVYQIDDEGNTVTSPYVYNENTQGYGDNVQFADAMRVVAVQDNFYETLSIRLAEGGYPQNDKEILLSSAMSDRYAGKKTGDKIIIGNIEYTISGIIENTEFEARDLELPAAVTYPIYTRLDMEALKENDIVSGYFYAGGVLDDIEEKAGSLVNELQASGVPQNKIIGESIMWFCDGTDVSYNYSVLSYLGLSQYDNMNNMMNTLKLILVVIIMIGSISLIANGFIISISERSRYLGMLASIGATKKQKRGSVYFEGFLEGVVSIPLGILVGFGGIGITFKLIEPIVNQLGGNNLGLRLIVNEKVIIWAVVFSVLTIFLSAYIPGRRASRIAPIDAIRQNKDVKISSSTVRTMGITKKIFGFEGDLALKNLKRNKKRYRVTVFSMFVSLTLFLSVYSLVSFMRSGYEAEMGILGYDMSFLGWGTEEIKEGENISVLNEKFKEITDKLIATDYIEEAQRYSRISMNHCVAEAMVDEDRYFNNKYLQYLEKVGVEWKDTSVSMVAMSEGDLKDYLDTIDVDYEKFISDESNVILFDGIRSIYYGEDDRYVYEGDIYSDRLKVMDYQITLFERIEGSNGYEETEGEKLNLKLNIYSSEEKLLGMGNGNACILVTPQLADKLYNQGMVTYYDNYMAVKTDKADELEKLFKEEISEQENNSHHFYVYNYATEVKMMENSLLLISVFVYGFIILMSLICVANIVNTISTSLALRRREFAMLKSAGMTDKAFRKMIAYESGFYGIKALIFGLPVGTVIMLWIRAIIQDSVDVELGIPWLAYIIAVIGVFIIISVTMIYSAGKIKKENLIDTLKNENA